MSDFILTFNKNHKLLDNQIRQVMQFYDDMDINQFEFDKFNLIISNVNDPHLWSPFLSSDKKHFIALSGRIALDSKEWTASDTIHGSGGLACKYIYNSYMADSLDGLTKLNGNYTVILYDAIKQKLFIVLDSCGMNPCFHFINSNNSFTICSHPDILASCTENSDKLDIISISEFLMTGKVTYPFTYYEKIKSLEYGSIYTFNLNKDIPFLESQNRYFTFPYSIDNKLSEWDLAEELASSFKKAVSRRSSALFGKTAIAMSGGLDSRAILCAAENRENIVAVNFFDEENLESSLANQIAEAVNVKMYPLKRDFDFYGKSSAKGIRIHGGMGNIGANHFLGFRNTLSEYQITNIITGFYCDYFFKGLAQNTLVNKLFRHQTLKDYDHQWYEWFCPLPFKNRDLIYQRLDELIPESLQKSNNDEDKLLIEQKRIFPLCYEPDNAETVIPQRVMPWYLPIVDNDILEIYLKISPKHKLNTSMYSKMVEILCGDKICSIPNINTGAKVNASTYSLTYNRYKRALKNRFIKRQKKIATDESWPNWEYYIHNSDLIKSQWQNSNDLSTNLFINILGEEHFKKDPSSYKGIQLKLFFRLYTIKLWLEHRICF